MQLSLSTLALASVLVASPPAEELIDQETIARIKMEGFQHSQVMDVLFQLTDVHGPRLHGSENYDKAATWSRDQLLEWGLDSAEIETWPSPVPGWSLSEFGIELLEPFAYLGASTLTTENTSGTDHLLFDAAGLPGFQFLQDPIEYGSLTHHTNMDVYDHVLEEDMKQAAVIVASVAYLTAMRDAKLPRKPLPGPRKKP